MVDRGWANRLPAHRHAHNPALADAADPERALGVDLRTIRKSFSDSVPGPTGRRAALRRDAVAVWIPSGISLRVTVDGGGRGHALLGIALAGTSVGGCLWLGTRLDHSNRQLD